jgi:tetratricopeptide (TPR) repeat protein
MSILDGMPRSEAELIGAMEVAAPLVQEMLEKMTLPPGAQNILELLRKGLSLADIYGITKEERDALFARGCHLLRAGDIKGARDWLTALYQLEPLDERAIYAIALSHQMEGNYSLAAKLYVFFIALDATNPEGHLRLGECFLSAREYDLARESFHLAQEQCSRGTGTPEAAAHAAKMLAHVREHKAPAA